MESSSRVDKFSRVAEKSVDIFQVELINQQNQPKIKPLYTGVEELKLLCERKLNLIKNHTKSSNFLDKPLYPIVWIDFRFKPSNESKEKQSQTCEETMFNKFKDIMQSENFQNDRKRSISKNNVQSSSKIQASFSVCSSSYPPDTKRSNNDKLDDSIRYIKATHMTVKLEQSQDSQVSSGLNILLLHTTILFTNCKKDLNRVINDLLSLSIYLADDIVVDCSSATDEKEKKEVNQLIENVGQKFQEIKKKSDKNSTKSKVHFICCDDEKDNENKQFLNFYQLKDSRNEKKVTHILQKVKSKILQGLTLKSCFSDKQLRLENFFKKCQISSRILERTQKQSRFHSQFSNPFSPQHINKITEEISRQSSLQETRTIRQKFQNFYGKLTKNNKSEFPLPQSILKFRVDDFTKENIKEVKSKGLLEKISEEYEKKIQQTNLKEIQKLLGRQMKQYLSSSVPQVVNDKQSLKYHPQKVSSLIAQFSNTMQSAYIFITQQHLQKFIYPGLYSEYYRRLFDQYTRVKRLHDHGERRHGEMTEELVKDRDLLRQELGYAMKKLEEKQSCCKSLSNELNNAKVQSVRLGDQLIVWKQRAEDIHKDLMQQLQCQKQLQSEVEQLRSCRLKQSRQSTSLQLNLNQQILQQVRHTQRQSLNLTECFQTQLNSYKQQYQILQKSLKQKQQFLANKQDYYKEKISLLQSQLSMSKNTIEQLQNEDNNKIDYRQNLRTELQKQFSHKTKWQQTQWQQKLQHYKLQVMQLQKMRDQRNKQLHQLGQDLYQRRRDVMKMEEVKYQLENRIKEMKKKENQLVKVVQQKDLLIDNKCQENSLLVQKVNQKMIKLQMLEEDIYLLKKKLSTQQTQNHILNNTSASFLKFQRDYKNPTTPCVTKSPLQALDMTVKSINAMTPLRRSISRVKNVTEINQNVELQRLIEERRTIQKRKERCTKRETDMLEKMDGKLGMRSQMSQKSNFFSQNNSIISTTEMMSRVLKQRNTAHGYKTTVGKGQQLDQLRKRLF